MSVENKNVFITGSTRGIGRAMALEFAKAGANVAVNGTREVTEEQLEELRSYGVKAIGVVGNIADFESAGEMVATVEADLGPVDVLVNNAGITKDNLVLRMKQEEFSQVLQINLTGTFNMTQRMLKLMLKRKSGSIINLASVVGLIGNVGQANYAASKAGVIGFTKSVAREVASRNISVNAIAPGFIETEMTEVLSDKVKDAMKATIPMKSLGKPEDVARVAMFLADSSYITGQVINVDGGMVMNA